MSSDELAAGRLWLLFVHLSNESLKFGRVCRVFRAEQRSSVSQQVAVQMSLITDVPFYGQVDHLISDLCAIPH